MCKRPIVGELRPNIPIQRLVAELSTSCPNEQCGKRIRIGDLNRHLAECEFSVVDCPVSAECGPIPRKFLDLHVEHECPYRMVSCDLHCGLRLPLNQVDEHIKNECPNFEMQCPNNCGQPVRRGEMLQHTQ